MALLFLEMSFCFSQYFVSLNISEYIDSGEVRRLTSF